MNTLMKRLTQHTDWLNHEREIIVKQCELLFQDVKFLQAAPVWRRLVALPDMAYAQWTYNWRVRRYNRILQKTTLLFHALQAEANQYLDHHFNQQFHDEG